ncbi:hypothetical protein [Paenibacillus albidus]|uniref:hypothetical protein n=1 Tax=Paenibacillus albidus TaxID=2041023 RepID=UPI00166E1CF9|nr:hypothetical protein [Paenibacillus albidus]
MRSKLWQGARGHGGSLPASTEGIFAFPWTGGGLYASTEGIPYLAPLSTWTL